jgi:hypothetical protein
MKKSLLLGLMAFYCTNWISMYAQTVSYELNPYGYGGYNIYGKPANNLSQFFGSNDFGNLKMSTYYKNATKMGNWKDIDWYAAIPNIDIAARLDFSPYADIRLRYVAKDDYGLFFYSGNDRYAARIMAMSLPIELRLKLPGRNRIGFGFAYMWNYLYRERKYVLDEELSKYATFKHDKMELFSPAFDLTFAHYGKGLWWWDLEDGPITGPMVRNLSIRFMPKTALKKYFMDDKNKSPFKDFPDGVLLITYRTQFYTGKVN